MIWIDRCKRNVIVLERFADGMTPGRIARDLGIQCEMVRHVLRAVGIDFRANGEERVVSKKARNAAIVRARELGVSALDLAARYDVSRQRIDQILARQRPETASPAREEREQDMHNRIRADYDKTVADLWRAANDKLRAENERLREALSRIARQGNMRGVDGHVAESEPSEGDHRE